MIKSRAEKELFLRGYEELAEFEKEKHDDLMEFRSMIESTKTQKYSGMPFGGKISGVEDIMAKLEALENELNMAEKNRSCRCNDIMEATSKLEDETERIVLTMRYLEFEAWDRVAHKIGKSLRHTHRIYARAVRNIRL